MMTKTIRRALAAASLTALAATAANAQDQAAAQAASGAATAQDQVAAEGAAGQIADIVVTAQFRGQRVQDTPIAITALGAQQIEERGLTRVTDITNTAPNVVMKPSGSVYGPAATLFIRGVGQTDSSFALDPGVGLYVDDVYRGITFGSLLDLLDLDRVEILRGPQGTLAGKNSIGGAVKLFSKLPNNELSGYVEAVTGSFKRLDVRGAFNLPLTDNLFLRVSAASRHRDGYLKRLDFNCANPNGPQAPSQGASTGNGCEIGREGGQDYTAGRAALRWVASDRVEINLSADRLVDDSEPTATKLISLNANPATTPNFPDRSVFLTGPRSYTNYSTYITPPFTDPAIYNGRPGAGSHNAIVFPTNNRIRAWDMAGTIDVRFSDTIALKSITAYQYTNGRYSTDNDVTPFGINTGVFTQRYKQYTQELRLNGEIGTLIDWTVGAYYFRGKGYLGGTNIINPGLASETVQVSDDYIPTTSKSGFAHAVVHVTDRLNLTGGIRYTHDEKSYSFQRLNVFAPGLPTYTPSAAINGLTSTFRGDRWDFRANVDYKLTDTVLAYAQFSTGYRGGGVNPRPFVIQQALPFGPETLNAYEIGLKTDLFDRTLRVNVAAFVNKYKDIIFTNTAPTIVNGVLLSAANGTPVNAGDGRFQGVEVEVAWRPVPGLTIDANGSYLDFDLQRLGAAGATIVGIALSNDAPYVTKWKAGGGIQYRADLGGAGFLTPRVDVAYQSSFYTNADNFPGSITPAYTVVNARLAYQLADSGWEAAVAVTNLFDRFYYQNKFRGPGIGVVTGQPAPPREWSLSLRKTF